MTGDNDEMFYLGSGKPTLDESLFPGSGKLTLDDVQTLLENKEVKITDAGGSSKGMKLPQLGAIDPVALLEVAKVAGYGTIKYGRGNYMKSGYDWSLNVDALFRHLLAWLQREDNDPESGLSHLAHAGWHVLTLIGFQLRGIGTDDRHPRPERGTDGETSGLFSGS